MQTLISPDNTWALMAIVTGMAALAIYLEQTYTWAAKLSGCVIALIGAIILNNLNIIPTDAPAYDVVWGYVVPLAIPLLLFKADLKAIWKDSGRLLVIYLLSSVGTLVGAFAAYHLFQNTIPELHKVAAMMTGTYTGGSVNLAAMAKAFDASGTTVSTSVVADNLLMAIYFFVLVAIPASNFFLAHYPHPLEDELKAQLAKGGEPEAKTNAAKYWKHLPVSLKDIALAFAVATIIVAIAANLASFLKALIPTGTFAMDLLNGLLGNQYLLITTLTVLAATLFPKFIGGIAGAQEIGTFFIHIFFVVIGAPASVYLIVTKAPLLLVFCAVIVGMNMVFSLVLGKIFHFTIEEICVASNANIGGPTTAAAYAIAKGWGALVVPSLLVGTLGYVIGNYYGIFVGTFLQR